MSARDADRRGRGGAAWVGLALLAVVVAFGVFVLAKNLRSDAELTPEARAVVGDDRSRWKVAAEPLRHSAGFEVVPLTDAEVRTGPRLADLLGADRRTVLVLTADEHAALRAFLAERLPDGWDDPFAYGLAWRTGNDLYRVTHEPMDLV